MDSSARTRRACAAANLAHLAVAERLRAALEGAQIRFAFLKGMAFLDTLYRDPASRALGDVDLLAPESAKPVIRQVLGRAGFSPCAAPATHPASWDSHYNWKFLSPERTLVEVHFTLAPIGLFAIDHDALLARAVIRREARRIIPMLSAEDTLLSLAVHEAKHGYAVGAQGREDARRVIAQWCPDWDITIDRARQWGVAAALWVTLRSADCGAGDVPARVLDRLEPTLRHRAAITAAIRLPAGYPRLPAARRQWAQAATMLVIADRWRNRALFVRTYAARRMRDALALGRARVAIFH